MRSSILLLPCAILLSVLGSFSWGVVFAGIESLPARALYRSGFADLAIDKIKADLQRDPSNADLHAMLGISLARVGDYLESLDELDLGRSSPVYDEEGIGAEADALRATGRPDQARKLRLERRILARDAYDEIDLLLAAADDARVEGLTDLAEDLIWEALSLDPDLPKLWAALADIEIDRGETRSAAAYLVQASAIQQGSFRALLVEARLGLFTGDLALSLDSARLARLKRPKHLMASVLLAEALRRSALPREARRVVDVRRLLRRSYPELLAVRALIAMDLGETGEARRLVDLASSLHPENAALGNALKTSEGALGSLASP